MNNDVVGWKRQPLSHICERLTDGSHFSPVPEEYGHSIANVKDLRNGYVDLASCTRISDKAFRQLASTDSLIHRGDILLSKDGTIGKVVIYDQPEVIEIGRASCRERV